MHTIWIAGGTTEARQLLEHLQKKQYRLIVSVATDYGKEVLSGFTDHADTQILIGRMDSAAMEVFIKTHHIDCVVDATHPHAVLVTEELVHATSAAGIPYLRVERTTSPYGDNEDVLTFDSITHAVAYLQGTTGNILAVTGAKELAPYTQLASYQDRLYVRVLPMESSLRACTDIGLTGAHILCMQGPFSKELNLALLQHTKAEFLITKNAGDTGGLQEKLEACRALSIKALLIETAPSVDGLSILQIIKKLEEIL